MAEARLTPEAAKVADQRLLHEVVSLLTGLEHEWARLSAQKGVRSDVAALTALNAIANAVASFVTTRCDDRCVLPSRVLAQLADTQPYTQVLGEDQEQFTVSTAAELLENWNGAAEDRQRMLLDLCRALIDVLVIYCQTVNSFFHSAHDRDEWASAVELFVEDLRSAVQQIAA